MMNDAITYEEVKGMRGSWKVLVRLDGKLTGEIRQVEGGFRYFPKGGGKGYTGELFKSVSQVQVDLEGDDASNHHDEGGRGMSAKAKQPKLKVVWLCQCEDLHHDTERQARLCPECGPRRAYLCPVCWEPKTDYNAALRCHADDIKK